jgi:ATP-dependent RNA helicase RhlE
VHRIGRTARAKTEGMAITYVAPEDMYKFTKIERLVERDYEKLPAPEHLGESPVWEVAAKGGISRNNRSKRRGDTPSGGSKPQSSGGGAGAKKRWRGPKCSGGGASQA